MLFYLSIPFLILIILAASDLCITAKAKRRFACAFSYMVLLFISVFRDVTVGGDLKRYLPTYYGVSTRTWEQLFTDYGNTWWSSEVGFRLIQKAMSLIDLSNGFYLLFTSLMVLSFSFYAIYKYSENVNISIYIYTVLMFVSSFNIIRASICVGLCLISYKFIVTRKLLPYTLILLLAFTIQKTTLLFYPAYFLYGRKYNPTLLIISMFSALALSFVITGSSLVNLVNTYFTIYDLDATDSLLNNNSTGLTSMGIFLTVLSLGSMCIYKKNNQKEKLTEFFIFMIVISTIIQYYSSIFMLLNRISYFYYSYLLFFIPYLFKFVGKNVKAKFFLSIVMCVFFLIYYSDILADGNQIMPYVFNFKLLL